MQNVQDKLEESQAKICYKSAELTASRSKLQELNNKIRKERLDMQEEHEKLTHEVRVACIDLVEMNV